MNELTYKEYMPLAKSLIELIHVRQYEALKQVNHALITLYWEIGQEIYSQQNEKGWGKSIVEVLSNELHKAFPDAKGYSARNLWNMRNFYLAYAGNEILQPLAAEISWSHNIEILNRCKDLQEREFYIRSVQKFGWSKNILIHQIENKTFQKLLLNQTNFDLTLPEPVLEQAKSVFKDEYTFDFVDLSEEHSERELEQALLTHIRDFLLEVGGFFTFVGSQYHLNVAGDDFYIDLLLYHRKLQSLVAVELKIDSFRPEHAGKMQFYLTALDEQVRLENENPSIGIIICREKNRTVVEYSIKEQTHPIGVATYRISDDLPDNLKRMLPTPEQIKNRLLWL